MMTDTAIQAPPGEALLRPGALGRAIRLGLGLAVLSLLWPLLTAWRAALFSGEVPWSEGGFGALVLLALWGTSYVFNIALGVSWGQKTRTGVVLGAVLAGVAGLVVSGEFPNAAFGVYLWAWFVALAGLLGPAHLLAAAQRASSRHGSLLHYVLPRPMWSKRSIPPGHTTVSTFSPRRSAAACA